MTESPKILRVNLSPSDLVAIIQKRGEEQGVNVSGHYTHYAYTQAHLLLAAEDLYRMLSRIVNEAKRLKGNNPLRSNLSDVLLKEATDLLQRVYHDES